MNTNTAFLWVSGGIAALAGGLALQGTDIGQEAWFLSRASGLVAFALLSASVILGLLLSTRTAKQLMPARVAADLHTFLSVLTLVFLGLHGGALLFDGFFHFTPLSLLVPFASPYEPLWTGLGVIGAWGTALVAASVRVRKQIGYATWRRLHYVSFLAYVLSLVHGMTAGTDTGLPAVQLLYIGSAAFVTALLMLRLLMRPETRAAKQAPAGQPGSISRAA